MNLPLNLRIPLVRLSAVTVTLGSKIALDNISLDIVQGEHTAITGANGAGKSTLLRILHGDLRPDQLLDGNAGKVFWGFEGKLEPYATIAHDHVRLVSPREHKAVSLRDLPLDGKGLILSGLENSPMLYRDATAEETAETEKMATAAGVKHLLAMPVSVMSQGQLRAMLLLRSLAAKPALLLLDEPFDGLDKATKKNIDAILSLAVERGSTLVLTAHRQEEIPDFIKRVLHVHGGRLATQEAVVSKEGNTAFTTMSTGSHAFGQDFNFAPGQDVNKTLGHAFEHVQGQTKGLVQACCQNSEDLPNLQVPVLTLEHVDVFINRAQVLFDLNWTINQGEQWIVTGVNGSGKSTLFRLLYGEEFAAWTGPERTQVRWFGLPRPPLDELRSLVGYVSDKLQENYWPDISARDVVVSGLRSSIGLYEPATRAEYEKADLWMERMGLISVREHSFLTLSSGWSRRVLLARALAASPAVLLLDEPCSGLDAESRELFLKALPMLALSGVHIIHISHHEADNIPLFTHELHLEAGRIVFARQR